MPRHGTTDATSIVRQLQERFLAKTNAMKHHLKGCLEDSAPDNIILHHGTNNLKSDDSSEKIVSDTVD